MKKILVCMLTLATLLSAAVSPPTAGGKLAIGYDGTDATVDAEGRVISWVDQVGSYNAESPLAGTRPILEVVNTGNGEHPVLNFNDGLKYLKTAAFSSPMSQANVVFLVTSRSQLAVDYLFDGIDGSYRNALYTRSDFSYGMFAGVQIINANVKSVADPNDFQVIMASFNGTSGLMRINGTNVLSGNAGTNALTGLTIGADRSGNAKFHGRIAEFLVYDGGLNTAQILAIEDYLTFKYITGKDEGVAKNPSPANSESGLPVSGITLSWTAGDFSDSRDVYFGTDLYSVTNATAAEPLSVYMGNQQQTTFSTGALELGTTYYWRVDEVDSASETVWTGEVWSFVVSEYVMLENFDDYEDESEMLVNWNSGGNAVIMFSDADYATYLYSMAINYSNASSPYYSEAIRTFSPAYDFTNFDVAAIDLRIKGAAENTASPFYITLSDGVGSATQYIDAAAVTNPNWSIKRFALQEFNGVDLTNITTMSIGIGDGSNPQQSVNGEILLDEIRLYPVRCLGGYPIYDFNKDCIVDIADFAMFASGWLSSGLWP